MGIYASILNNNYTFANSHVRKQQSVALLELPPEVLLAPAYSPHDKYQNNDLTGDPLAGCWDPTSHAVLN